MSNQKKALETQLSNIETKTGKSRAKLAEFVNASSFTKHSELREMVSGEFGLEYGVANALVHFANEFASGSEGGGGEKSVDDPVSEIYSGNKGELQPIHDEIKKQIHNLGDFEIAPKKKYLSLRRKKQFAMVGPASKGRVEVGLNMKGIEGTSRLESLPPGGMCQYRVFLTYASEVDEELIGWIKIAYESAV